MPHVYRDAVVREIEIMLEESVIKLSNSEWASPMVIIRKRDDIIRLCVDYRKLNAEDAYLMPRDDDILDQVGQANTTWICQIVLAGSCCRGGLAQDSIHYYRGTLPIQDDAVWALWQHFRE